MHFLSVNNPEVFFKYENLMNVVDDTKLTNIYNTQDDRKQNVISKVLATITIYRRSNEIKDKKYFFLENSNRK